VRSVRDLLIQGFLFLMQGLDVFVKFFIWCGFNDVSVTVSIFIG